MCESTRVAAPPYHSCYENDCGFICLSARVYMKQARRFGELDESQSPQSVLRKAHPPHVAGSMPAANTCRQRLAYPLFAMVDDVRQSSPDVCAVARAQGDGCVFILDPGRAPRRKRRRCNAKRCSTPRSCAHARHHVATRHAGVLAEELDTMHTSLRRTYM